MKIRCTCDNIIVDQTDYLKYKGYIISDTQWFDFWNAIDDEIKKSGQAKEDDTIHIQLQELFRTAWECSNCGRLFIEAKSGELIEYSPNNNGYNEILNKKE